MYKKNFNLIRTTSRVVRGYKRAVAAAVEGTGLKSAEAIILIGMVEKRGTAMTSHEIHEHCVMDKAAVSRSLKSLMERGYVENDMLDGEKNRYFLRYELTSDGVRMAHKLEQRVEEELGFTGNIDEKYGEGFLENMLEALAEISDHMMNVTLRDWED